MTPTARRVLMNVLLAAGLVLLFVSGRLETGGTATLVAGVVLLAAAAVCLMWMMRRGR